MLVIRLAGFQSTRPCGARRADGDAATLASAFQSTRPCGARLDSRVDGLDLFSFQSTRPCGARHLFILAAGPIPGVSIHAPVRGATSGTNPANPYTVFQSTRPCGARRPAPCSAGRVHAVSIHAPVRGATLWQCLGSE